MMAINTGTPTPTLKPMISLLLTPPVFPSRTLLLPALPELPDEEDVVGTYDIGLPVVAVIS